VPLGTVGHLVTNTPNKMIDLVVSSIAQTVWIGAANGNWDTSTTNWSITGTPVSYAQFANVLFNNSASNFNVTSRPRSREHDGGEQQRAGLHLLGSGSLSGNMTLVKDGTNTATLSTANTYTGNTTIKAGKSFWATATALGASTATVTCRTVRRSVSPATHPACSHRCRRQRLGW